MTILGANFGTPDESAWSASQVCVQYCSCFVSSCIDVWVRCSREAAACLLFWCRILRLRPLRRYELLLAWSLAHSSSECRTQAVTVNASSLLFYNNTMLQLYVPAGYGALFRVEVCRTVLEGTACHFIVSVFRSLLVVKRQPNRLPSPTILLRCPCTSLRHEAYRRVCLV
jgi:hypothetical protein